MTARDFTPTDEQVRDCAMHLFQADTGKEIPRVDEFAHYLGLARMVFATDAQKSIIAAAKAEARAEIAAEIEAVDMWVKDETSEYVSGSDDAARAIVAFIRKQNEASA